MSDHRDGRAFIDRRLRILTPLRHRDFRMLWTGMTASLLGDGIFYVALAWQAYELSNTPSALSMIGVAMTVPHVVFLLAGGVVSDRFDRRKVMIAADLMRAAAVGAMGVLALSGRLELWHMFVLSGLFGAGTAFFGPAFDAIVPGLVPDAELNQANSLDQLVRPAALRMLGPALGGWIVATGGAGAAFVVDAGTFAFSISCVALMRVRRTTSLAPQGSAIGDIREGFAFVRSQVWLWGTFLAATLGYLTFWGPSEVLLPYVVRNDIHGSAADLGLIFAVGGIGAMTSAIVMGNRQTPRRNMTFIYVVWTVSTLAIAGYGLARFPWQAMAACFAFNALEGAGTIVWATTKGRLVPGRLLGRVSSFDWFISIALVPISYAFTGPVAEKFGAQETLVGAALLGGAITLAFLFLPGMRDIERTGVLLGSTIDATQDKGFGGLEGPVAPISAGQEAFPPSGTSGAPLRSTVRP
ncbi:MAG TPA: MFS transporter, partial [Actinomycetota bacterium]|nr:MFS transporter [Actinomycetota bacterium]